MQFRVQLGILWGCTVSEERFVSMVKHKNLLIAAGVLLVLISAASLIPPTPSHSQGTATGFPVEVVNLTGKPVPTSAQGTTTVGGTVQAQQNGNWSVGLATDAQVGIDPESNNVNVANTPNVNIANTPIVGLVPTANLRINNTAATPVLTREVGGNAQPFQGSASILMSSGATTGNASVPFGNNIFTVPAGKRLAIEQVTVRGHNLGFSAVLVAIETTVGGVTTRFFLPVNGQGFSPIGVDRFAASHQMRIFADPGTQVRFVATVEGGVFANINNVEIVAGSIAGKLEDLPPA
jgi:hypothetical protein